MSTPEERGALGKRFHDLPTTPANPELAWEQMAKHILTPTLPPEEAPRKKRPFFFWWLTGLILFGFGVGIYLSDEETIAPQPAQDQLVPVATTETEVAKETESVPTTTNTLALTALPAKMIKQTPVIPRQEQHSDVVAPNEEAMKGSDVTPSEIKEEAPVISAGRAELTYLVDRVETLPIERLPLFPKQPRPEASPAVLPPRTTSEASLVFAIGAADFQSQYQGDAPWLLSEENDWSPEIGLRYERQLGERWFLSVGPDVRQYRFRTAFENIDPNARIYQPGTVDTIFRNLTTGEERVVTTDTVPGVRTRRFGHDNTITELGFAFAVGRQWTAGKHAFTLAGGPRLGLVIHREGRTVVGTNSVTDVVSAPQFGQSFRVNGRLEVGYAYLLSNRLSVVSRLSGEASLSDWSTLTSLQQRPTTLSGQLGLRYVLK